MSPSNPHPFDTLTPDLILDAIESVGFFCDGSVFALNSYENRVFQVGIEDEKNPIIAKFYRPNRWQSNQIQEEHDFCIELESHEISVISPLKIQNQTLFEHKGFNFTLFPRTGGYAPELDHKDNLAIMGRMLARLHCIGETNLFQHRPILDIDSFGVNSVTFVKDEFIPLEHKSSYDKVTQKLLELMTPKLENCLNIRVHGDLHIGNILMRDDTPYLVDFDDSRLAPAIQDIWMLLSGEEQEQRQQLHKIIKAYQGFRPFPYQEIEMIESLRTLRMMHHCAWLAQRFDDPAFPDAFPWFDTNSYWIQHINDLNNQIDAIQNNPFVGMI
jgi:Ser/Thr protein kinase RdoA (MazF antagonist)